MQYGLDAYLGKGLYDQETGAKFNGSSVSNALSARLNTDLLFPVYDTLRGSGTNAQYNIIGWVAFHLTSFEKTRGNDWTLTGYFQSVIWKAIQSKNGQHTPDFGVYTIALVN